MRKQLYHGSVVPNITELLTNAKFHDGKHDILYLTNSLPYSLFYIWDSKHNLKKGKHVTCWIKNGIVYYEEPFESQLKRFYDGVSGFVYVVKDSDSFRQVTDRESMWFSDNNVLVSEVIYVPNVYDEIQIYDSIFEYIQKQLKVYFGIISDEQLTDILTTDKFIIILDGVDEILNPENRVKFFADINMILSSTNAVEEFCMNQHNVPKAFACLAKDQLVYPATIQKQVLHPSAHEP